MGIENDRKLVVNCLPLTEAERAQFTRAAKGMPQEFVGDPAQRGSMNWTAEIPDELKAYATAVIGNITPETCAQCPRLEWLQTWSAGVDKYQRPGVLHPGSMLTNATGAYGQSVSEHMFAMMWSIMKNLHIYAVGNPNAAWQDAGRVISPDGKTALIIGTGDTATAEQANEVNEEIRTVIRKLYGARVARSVTILYGGSMNEGNARELLAQPDVDGGLIGGAALKAEKFAAIVKAATEG